MSWTVARQPRWANRERILTRVARYRVAVRTLHLTAAPNPLLGKRQARDRYSDRSSSKVRRSRRVTYPNTLSRQGVLVAALNSGVWKTSGDSISWIAR